MAISETGQVTEKRVINTPEGSSERVEVRPSPTSPDDHRMGQVRRVQGLIWFVGAVVLVTILFRFSLLLLGANPDAGFADFVYSVSHPLVAPFLALFGQEPIYGRSTLEFSDLVAMCLYLVIAAGLSRLVPLVMAPSDPTGGTYK
ncbi:MAG: hypothetical protein HY319_25260 [Armatimonadetes bacterium]|nr:hypothetical protein [Armatimonadota bacterium]